MIWLPILLFGSFCLFFIYGAVTFFKEGDKKGGIWLSIFSVGMIILTSLITVQEKHYEEFVNKCHDSHGVVTNGKCLDERAVITIER